MKGFFEAVKTGLGDSAVKYLDTVVGQMVDDYLKDMVNRAIQGNPFDGYYKGRLSSAFETGSIRFHINGSMVSGTVSGSSEGDPFTGSFSGAFTQTSEVTGRIRCTLGGTITTNEKSYRYGGNLNGSIDDGSASGTHSAVSMGIDAAGKWSATKGK